MPDHRRHRGAHPDDARLFAPSVLSGLRLAVEELAWLLGRGYASDSAVKLVGDRHALTARQRMAVRRATCTDEERALRGARRAARPPTERRIALDGYNVLITIESALSGAVVLGCRDGSYRDLASLHGSYRRVEETSVAIALVGALCDAWRLTHAVWYLDRPVSNSGRLRAQLCAALAPAACTHEVELVDDPDRELPLLGVPVASSDSLVLERSACSIALAETVIDERVPGVWRVMLG